jgi:hypothetical protein
MFSLFALLALLISALPLSGMGPQKDINLGADNLPFNIKITASPTPTIVLTNKNQDNNSQKNNPPGQTISQIANQDHDGGISDKVHEIIPGNKFHPTPILSPVPVTTDTPTPTPGEIEPSVIPNPPGNPGCPPCQSGVKFLCPEVVCPL